MYTLNEQTLVVRAITNEARGVRSFEVAREDGTDLPAYTAGAHVVVHLANGLTRQYSLFDAPGDASRYRFAVLKDASSRGGSQHLHEQVAVGDSLVISGPFNHFPMTEGSDSVVLIAGGIGITPILSMAHVLHKQGTSFALYYCARAADGAAFVELLNAAPFKQQVHLVFDGGDPAKGLDVKALLTESAAGRHLYCCGPNGLMDAVQAAAAHWPADTVHFERFKADAPVADAQTNTPFTLFLKRSRTEHAVPCDKSILQVLRESGFKIKTVCEEGVCGSCLTDVVEGIPEHRDHILNAAERNSNDVMAICCSRSKSERLVLDM